MKHPQVTLRFEELCRLLPDLEELEGLRLSIAGAAVPDPTNEWNRSQAYTTIDRRLVSLDGIEQVVHEAEEALHQYVASLFSTFPPVFRAYYTGQHQDAVRHLIELGEKQEQLGHYRKARQCFEAALGLSLPLPHKEMQILALRRIARVALALGDLKQALVHYQRSAELARDTQDLRGEVIAQTGYGNVLLMQGRWTESERCYREALTRVESVGDGALLQLERAQLFNNLGMITTHQGGSEEAEAWFERALELWAVITSPVDLATCYHNQGLLREKQGRLDEARDIYQHALALAIPSALRATIAVDLAECYLKDGHLQQAEQCGRVAEEHAIAARSPYCLGHMYRGLGNIARARGDAEGFIFFEKALEIAREKGYPPLEAETLVDYAMLRSQTGENEEAQAYMEHAREIFGRIGAVHGQARAEQLLREPTL